MSETLQLTRKTALVLMIAGSVVFTGCRQKAPDNGALIYDGFGNYQRTISTSSESAQQWFDQGMQLMYGFNHDEAIRSFEQAWSDVPEDWWVFNNRVHEVLPIARAMINGELLFREGKHEEAFAILREGVEAEDALVYDEPPAWMLPVRHALGALLMSAGRYSEAEAIYREDLQRNRDNGWSLTGLKLALEKQGRDQDEEDVEIRLARAFRTADTKPSSSCYCEP